MRKISAELGFDKKLFSQYFYISSPIGTVIRDCMRTGNKDFIELIWNKTTKTKVMDKATIPFTAYCKYVTYALNKITGGTATTEELNKFQSNDILECTSCKYELSLNEKKVLVNLGLTGLQSGSNIYGIPFMRSDCCPKCGYSEAQISLRDENLIIR